MQGTRRENISWQIAQHDEGREIDLGRKIREGDEAAQSKLIEKNLRLVIPIAKKYRRRGLPFGDLGLLARLAEDRSVHLRTVAELPARSSAASPSHPLGLNSYASAV